MLSSSTVTGNFISTGNAELINLRMGLDWIEVRNLTVAAANQTNAIGVEYYWQQGMPQGSQVIYLKSEAASADDLEQYSLTGGFTLIDTSANAAGTINATITAVSTAAIPVVSNSGSNNLTAGSIVKLYNIAGAQQLGGIDFTVGYNTLTSGTFSLDYMSQVAAGTTGSWSLVPYDAMFYPRRRVITKITRAAQAVVTLSVTHGYKVGQVVRMQVPAEFGMTQMNGIAATIVAVDTTSTSGNTITLDVNSSSFTAFTFPLTSNSTFTPAMTVPMAENTAVARAAGVDDTTDATINTAFIGVSLAAGSSSPAGSIGDSIFWRAGVSFDNYGLKTL